MKNISLFLFATALFIAGCGTSTEEIPATQPAPSEQATEEHHHAEEALQLNKGEKWKVDESMMAHLRQMEKDVNTFSGKTAEDHKELAGKLQTSLDLLTSGCTMTGQAHDELHKWLVPYIDMVGAYAESKTAEEAAMHFEKIKVAFGPFNEYFQ